MDMNTNQKLTTEDTKFHTEKPQRKIEAKS